MNNGDSRRGWGFEVFLGESPDGSVDRAGQGDVLQLPREA
jgi:hypothetical protein